MLCIACSDNGYPLCPTCERSLRATPPRPVAGIPVFAAYTHAGTGSALVRALKYHGSSAAADLLAAEMARRVPAGATALVPVPRVAVRRVLYGVDQTRELATRVARATGVPVAASLRAPLWSPRLAGRRRDRRHAGVLRPVAFAPAGSVIIDDVCTSGATIGAAVDALGGRAVAAVVATSAPDPRSIPSQWVSPPSNLGGTD